MKKIEELIKMLHDQFEIKFLNIEETESIPHVGLYLDNKTIDTEHDYSTLAKIICIKTDETDECDHWDGVKYLILFSDDGINISDWKLMGKSDKIIKLLFY